MALVGRSLAVVGATGTLGAELLEVLEARRFPVVELRAYAGEDSLGEEVEFQGQSLPVETGEPRLAGLDLVFLCAPPGASLDAARLALRASVPCIDVSGALADREEIPLLVAQQAPGDDVLRRPALCALGGAALAWALVLGPLHREAGLRRVVGTQLEAASGGGRRGVLALSAETIAIFNQEEPPEPEVFPHAMAFDCVPVSGAVGEGGATETEHALARRLRRVLDPSLRVAATAVRVPTFCGDGTSLLVETERALDPEAAVALLRAAEDVALWDEIGPALSTRASAGLNQVIVGRVRRDPSSENALLLWLAADAPRTSAVNAVRLAEARLAAV